MWGAIIGGLVGAGAGYVVSLYSFDAIDACYSVNYQPNVLDITSEQKVTRMEQVGAACDSQHPIMSFFGDHHYTTMGGALVLGSLIGYFVGKR